MESSVEIRKVCANLISGTYICRYNKNLVDAYNFAYDNKEDINDYLKNVGYDLVINETYQTISATPSDEISNKGYRGLRKNESIILLLLAREQLLNVQKIATETVPGIKVGNIIETWDTIYNKSPAQKRISINNEIKDFFYTLQSYGFVIMGDKKSNFSMETQAFILPSICTTAGIQGLKDIQEKLQMYEIENDDTTNEDETTCDDESEDNEEENDD